MIEKLFEPFSASKRLGKGTGLGMASVNRIVANHSGDLEVKSELNKSTRFRVYLPAAETARSP